MKTRSERILFAVLAVMGLLAFARAHGSDVPLRWDAPAGLRFTVTNSLGAITNVATTNATMQVGKGQSATFWVRSVSMANVVSDWSAPAYWPIWKTNYSLPVAARLISGYWTATLQGIPGTYYGVQESVANGAWVTHTPRILARPDGKIVIAERKVSGESSKRYRSVYPPLQ